VAGEKENRENKKLYLFWMRYNEAVELYPLSNITIAILSAFRNPFFYLDNVGNFWYFRRLSVIIEIIVY